MVDEGVVDLGAEGVDVAPRAQQRRQVVLSIDAKVLDKGSRAVVVGEDDGEVPCQSVSGGEP